jgi:SAM-dependent methyltransferase
LPSSSGAAVVERLDRERAFHDRAFSHDVRHEAHRFYAIGRERAAYCDAFAASRVHPGSRVLEYGCGRGSDAFWLARRGAHVTGIDLSAEGIAQARARAREEGLEQRLDFRVMNAETLDFPDDSFDFVCGTGILHHLDLRAAYAELARTLKPGGAALFHEPLGHNPAINLYRRRTPHLRTPAEHPLTVADLELARSFFDGVRMRFFDLAPLLAVPLRRRPAFGRVLAALGAADRVLFALVPRARRYAWTVVLILQRPGIGG